MGVSSGHGYDAGVLVPSIGDTWCSVTTDELPIGAIYEWCVRPECGAVVLFSGTVRDHATDEGGVERTGVTFLDYEAYDTQVGPALDRIADEIRRQWPSTGRIVLVHRVGRLELGVSSVVVAVSAAHRPEAFEAARFGIDTLKATAPIWKRESWENDGATGSDWGLRSQTVRTVNELAAEQNRGT
jgi:molybdopterin synthase catalytic subunit